MQIVDEKEWISLFKENLERVLIKTVLANPYIPHRPFRNQVKFLIHPAEEIFYGGAAGGGKSDALLMAALQYVTEPDYHALLLRRTYMDLSMPNAIMNRCHEWMRRVDEKIRPHWDRETKTYTFPSGATLSFGYLAHANDLDQYQGTEVQFVGYDELTQFTEEQYTYLHSRLRKLKNNHVPIRMRSTGNPGGRGHDWVKARFIDEKSELLFIPSKYTDNEYLNQEEYSKQLDKLSDEVKRQQLKYGDWDVRPSTNFFKTENLHIDQEYKPQYNIANCRSYDIAYTSEDEAKDKGTDADYTAGVHAEKISETHYIFSDFLYQRLGEENINKIQNTARFDGLGKPILIETGTKGGAAKELFRLWDVNYLPEYDCYQSEPIGSKADRAAGLRNAIYQGYVHIYCPDENLLRIIKNQLESFPQSGHKDIVDAMSHAFNFLKDKTDGKSIYRTGNATYY